MNFELILNELQFVKLLDEANKLNRNIRIQKFDQLPCSSGAINYLISIETQDPESIFFLGVAWALPEETKWSKFLKQLRTWLTLR